MLRNLFARWARRHPDPTQDWPVALPDTPPLDLRRGTVGPIRFGDPLQSACVFGRPDCCRLVRAGYFELVYAGAGFQIDFEDGRLAYAAFFLGPEGDGTGPEGLRSATLQLDGQRLSGHTALAHLAESWGPASTEERDDEEIVVWYLRSGFTVELEARPDGLLKRVNAYPAEGRHSSGAANS